MYYKIINKKKKIVTIIIDLLGYIIWAPVNLFKKRSFPSNNIRKILVIRTAYIGDVVMTLPILKPLKELYPDSMLTFLTGSKAAELLRNNSYIDEILVYDAFWFYTKVAQKALMDYFRFLKVLRRRVYDLVIEARGDIRDIALLAYLSKSRYKVSYKVGGGGYLLTHVVPYEEVKHKVEYHLDIVRFLGGDVTGLEWKIYLTPEEKTAIDTLLSEIGVLQSSFLVGIHPGGRKELKCWAPDRFAKLADCLISEYGAKVIFTGSPEEKGLITDIIKDMEHEAINLAGKTNLRVLTGLIGRFNLFICNDTAPLHLASTMATPTVAVFGPSKSRETGPYGNIHRVVEKDFKCRFNCDEDVCNHINFKECMEKIQVDDVLNAVREVLGEVNKKAERHEIQN